MHFSAIFCKFVHDGFRMGCLGTICLVGAPTGASDEGPGPWPPATPKSGLISNFESSTLF